MLPNVFHLDYVQASHWNSQASSFVKTKLTLSNLDWKKYLKLQPMRTLTYSSRSLSLEIRGFYFISLNTLHKHADDELQIWSNPQVANWQQLHMSTYSLLPLASNWFRDARRFHKKEANDFTFCNGVAEFFLCCSQISTNQRNFLYKALVLSTVLYSCESWTITAETTRRIQSFETKCFRRLLGISWSDRKSNEQVRAQMATLVGPQEPLLVTVKRRKLSWFGHVTRHDSMTKIILQGTLEGGRWRGRQMKSWMDNIKEWTAPLWSGRQRTEEAGGAWLITCPSCLPYDPSDQGIEWVSEYKILLCWNRFKMLRWSLQKLPVLSFSGVNTCLFCMQNFRAFMLLFFSSG